ncbi:MAG TPA: hypothetical protein VEW03_07360 [Longimicrobiaceae bacterium]|nr:hypothetical protein [Longimicrobiaceae bacterium]
MSEKTSIETILKWIVLVILAMVAIKVVFTVLGLAVALGGFLLFRILPLVLLVWLAVKLVEWLRERNGGTAEVEVEVDPDVDAES